MAGSGRREGAAHWKEEGSMTLPHQEKLHQPHTQGSPRPCLSYVSIKILNIKGQTCHRQKILLGSFEVGRPISKPDLCGKSHR